MVTWPKPQSIKELRGFSGLIGYYRKFVRGYGSISQPLTDRLKKNQFQWCLEAVEAFRSLKKAMITALVLKLPNFSKPFVIEVDASMKEMGAIVMQEQHPIAFINKSLGVENEGLSTYEKELMVILYTISKWRHYLEGEPFIIKTDKKSIKYLLEQRLNSMIQQCGIIKLLGLEYKIQYKKGSENVVADALSGRGQGGKGTEERTDLEELGFNNMASSSIWLLCQPQLDSRGGK